MDTRRLESFVKIVDVGSITKAADILHIAQPALSAQISALESQYKQKLLIRSKQGVAPTEAGRALYQQAQIILRQVEIAQAAVRVGGRAPAGRVSVGLAPLTSGSALALPLLKEVRRRYPDIVLYINQHFGGVLSEAIMTGRMDMAYIYDSGPRRGVELDPVLTEELMIIAAPDTEIGDSSTGVVRLADLADVPLLMPSQIHTLRQVMDTRLADLSLQPRIAAELDSIVIMMQAVRAGLGTAVMPLSIQRNFDMSDLTVRRIVDPEIQLTVSICTSEHQPMSEPALAVHQVLVELIESFATAHSLPRPVSDAADGSGGSRNELAH
jgi:LysR family nitrogen assimilation transcriptional regulator